jgi:hypothetical protein
MLVNGRIMLMRTIPSLLSFALASALVMAMPASADVAADFAATNSPYKTAQNAKRDSVTASDAVKQLIGAGANPISAVQAVVRAYNDCGATYDAVRSGVETSPDAAPDIVAAIAGAGNCACTGSSQWPKSRLQRRVRPEAYRTLFNLDQICSCSALGVSAAAEVQPEKVDAFVDAALRAGERSATVVDSIGQVGKSPGNAWGTGAVTTANSIERQGKICKGDINIKDEFNPENEWVTLADAGKLGSHSTECGDEQDSEGNSEQGEPKT